MSAPIHRSTVIGVWFAVLAAIAGFGAVTGASITLGTGALWLAAWLVPSAVMLMVWRGAPPATVAELLHRVERRV